jgi:hypothetical protein
VLSCDTIACSWAVLLLCGVSVLGYVGHVLVLVRVELVLLCFVRKARKLQHGVCRI